MKKILTLFFLILAANLQAQDNNNPRTTFNKKVEFKGYTIVYDTALYIKKDSDSSKYFIQGHYQKIRCESCDSTVIYPPLTKASIVSSDFDSTSLSNRINLKVDSIKRKIASDSVFYYIAGLKHFAFIDSIGAGINIYNSDGTLTGDRALEGNDHYLLFNNLHDFSADASHDFQFSAGVKIVFSAPVIGLYVDDSVYINKLPGGAGDGWQIPGAKGSDHQLLRITGPDGNTEWFTPGYLDPSDTSAMLDHYIDRADTAAMLSYYLRSLTAAGTYATISSVALKLNISDTSAMLANYLRSAAAAATYATIANLALKLNISDTAAMLLKYLLKSDTASMLTPYIDRADTASMLTNYLRNGTAASTYATIASVALKVNISDTSAMLIKYTLKSDTASMLSPYLRSAAAASLYATISALNAKLNISDTSAMLDHYIDRADTASMLANYLRSASAAGTYATIANLALKVNISDTAAMLSKYLLKSDTATMLNNYIDRADTAAMLATYLKIVTAGATYVPGTRSISTNSPLTGGGVLSSDLTLSVNNAQANSSNKGVATFTTNDFNDAAGTISLDYTNGQAASNTNKGFLSSSDWINFNGKLSTVSGTPPIIVSGGSTISVDTGLTAGKVMTPVYDANRASTNTISGINGVNFASANVKALLEAFFFPSQVPTGSIGGGLAIEDTAGTASTTRTITWQSCRQASTLAFSSIVIGGVSISVSGSNNPGAGACTPASQAQNITVVRNTDVCFQNITTTTDSKTIAGPPTTCYTWMLRRYYGRTRNSSDTNSTIAHAPTAAEVVSQGTPSQAGGSDISKSQFNNSGSNDLDLAVTIPASRPWTVYYAYPATFDDLSSIVINNTESILTFTKITVSSVDNARGVLKSYKVYYSNNTFTGDTPTISFR